MPSPTLDFCDSCLLLKLIHKRSVLLGLLPDRDDDALMVQILGLADISFDPWGERMDVAGTFFPALRVKWTLTIITGVGSIPPGQVNPATCPSRAIEGCPQAPHGRPHTFET